jgi:4-alpha-glucanotransferase
MRVIQVLPVNDTTTDGHWHDSYPYNIVSCFALHPHYLDLEQLGSLKDKSRMTVFRRQQRELNALSYSDYEAVGRVKREYVSELFAERGKETLSSPAYREWVESNRFWLEGYAQWLTRKTADQGNKTANVSLIYYMQYHLHLQLQAAADYARRHGVVLKGDLPIGVNRESAETAEHPQLFNLDMQAGAPPDAFSPIGQNWGFPTYCWNDKSRSEVKTTGTGALSSTSAQLRLEDWFRRRMKWMGQYFDVLRIDHVLGFFRIWEIPAHAIYAQLRHFSPALPLTVGEIEYFGLSFRRDLFTRPFINDRVLDRLFGIHAQYVRDSFLVRKAYGLYDLREEYDTQRKVMDFFEGRGDENSLWIRDGLLRLIANVLFVEDPQQSEMYHPRIAVYQETVFDALSNEEKDAFMRLYNNYFYQRHDFFWGHEAISRLESILGDTHMLACAEDLGMLPSCVSPVLDQLRILTLEVQSMPKLQGQEFAHLDGYPYRSVATFSTHDMPPLRLWWQESPERTQRYYVTMLQKQGRAPEQLPAHLAEEILARHLYCPSMLCMLSLQDWLSMDVELRSKHPRDERINVPSDPYNRWQWRMHLTIEQLQAADRYNNKVRTMITRSRR